MPDGFALEVVTPDRLLVDTPAAGLVLRTTEGDMTVLDGHTSLIAAVVPGIVRVDPVEGEPVNLTVHGGFLQVDTSAGQDEGAPSGLSTRVTLLAGIAEMVSEIDVDRARQAKEAAEARVASAPPRADGESGDELSVEEQDAAAELARAELRLEAAGAAS
jgi:F-type H+-transporting ATPase subunit epsilon